MDKVVSSQSHHTPQKFLSRISVSDAKGLTAQYLQVTACRLASPNAPEVFGRHDSFDECVCIIFDANVKGLVLAKCLTVVKHPCNRG